MTRLLLLSTGMFSSSVLLGCTPQYPMTTRDPSLEFMARQAHATPIEKPLNQSDTPRAMLVADSAPSGPQVDQTFSERSIDQVPAMIPSAPGRDYNGPLSLGDPGVRASLWRESGGPMNDIFHDYRAWKPMDLLTIIINERAQGNKQANTRVNKTSSFQAAIENLIGIDTSFASRNPGVDPSSLINAETETEFTGQGQTLRQDLLTGTISAMVTEVLPSGILRLEGEKIITVNGEEQTMKITGLVRPRDVNSNNEVASTQIANVRIDYFGRGTLGDSQSPGWLGKILNVVWPF